MLDLDAIAKHAEPVGGDDPCAASCELMADVPALIARVRELEEELSRLHESMGLSAMSAAIEERQRCLSAVDWVAAGYVELVYWAEKVRREIEAV